MFYLIKSFYWQLGFDSVHFARIDYQDRAKRKEDKSLEVIWRGSKTFGSSSQVGNCDLHYQFPSCFLFEFSHDHFKLSVFFCRFLPMPFPCIIVLQVVSILN